MPTFLFALQAATLLQPRPDFKPPEPSIDTRTLSERHLGCRQSGPADEIIVCGRREAGKYRALPLPIDYEEGPLRAETSLGGDVKGSVDVEQADVGGFTSNRVKVRIKVPF
jgi:hypothetical protein